jgi:hypothetical protein
MPFCPSCRAEFKPDTTKCADCGDALVDRLADDSSTDDMVDIYECYEPQQAERLATVLSNRAVHVLVRDRSSSAFPTNVGKTAQQLLAVPREQREHAQSIIEAAIHDGVVPPEGKMIPEED